MALLISVFSLPATAGEASHEPVADTAESHVLAYRRLRTEALAAAAAEDLDTAAARLAEADARVSNHPGLIILRARIATQAGREEEALTQIRRYAAAGLTLDLTRDRILSTLSAATGFPAAVAALNANRAPVGDGQLTEMARIDGAVIVEALVRDEPGGRWLISQVRGRTIIALADDGTVSGFLRGDPAIGGVVGMALDSEAGLLWAATSPLAPAIHGIDAGDPRPVPALLKIDLATGTVLDRLEPPSSPTERSLGDIVRTADGTIHVADAATGDILSLPPGGSELGVLVPAGTLGSPQGMVPTPDGASLIVADYSSGLWRVDRDTGSAQRLSAPVDASLIGVDGLTSDGRVLYAFQNGVTPQRVLRLTLVEGWTAVSAVEVLAANLPIIDEPTTGLVRNGELVFVSRSQWSDFNGDGAQTTPMPAPAIIARLPLD
ncbi:MAG: hypothetical protein Q8S03_10060 [Brevundimonas sp.]|uniref:hypothetical protein n=1 Tax=Brevundimonas sp. TaxID=1871086 RepID=UPI0027340F7A|nr:hypothetical protein [Brevundimonas sp.]MDP3405023.1 hypothetical protein [Brevundimonas sp.]